MVRAGDGAQAQHHRFVIGQFAVHNVADKRVPDGLSMLGGQIAQVHEPVRAINPAVLQSGMRHGSHLNHGAHQVALGHGLKASIDLLQRQAQADQLIELELSIEIGLGQPGKVALRPGPAIA